MAPKTISFVISKFRVEKVFVKIVGSLFCSCKGSCQRSDKKILSLLIKWDETWPYEILVTSLHSCVIPTLHDVLSAFQVSYNFTYIQNRGALFFNYFFFIKNKDLKSRLNLISCEIKKALSIFFSWNTILKGSDVKAAYLFVSCTYDRIVYMLSFEILRCDHNFSIYVRESPFECKFMNTKFFRFPKTTFWNQKKENDFLIQIEKSILQLFLKKIIKKF